MENSNSTNTVEDNDEVIYILGCWINPYRPGDSEHYWMVCYDGKKEARDMGKRKQDRGQPKTFTDWVKGGNKYFTSVERFVSACNKVGINPNLKNL